MTEYLIANIGGIGSIALHSHNTLTWSAKLEVETPHGVEFGYQNMNIFDSSFEDERVGFSLKLRKKSSTDLRMSNEIQCVQDGRGGFLSLITERLNIFKHFRGCCSSWFERTFWFLREFFDFATMIFHPKS